MKIAPLPMRSLFYRYTSTQAGPRPFPSPYNIGIDIAETRRFIKFVPTRQELQRNSQSPHNIANLDCIDYYGLSGSSFKEFVKKTFNYAEWGELRRRLLSHFNDPNADGHQLAQFLASRWAAKEAAIKAHSHRRLHYRDVIVAAMPLANGSSSAPGILINPLKPFVLMTDAVAMARGLSMPGLQASEKTREDLPRPRRPAKTLMSERQMGRVSISHDAGLAIAVVQALDEPVYEMEPVMDDGNGDPIHEPFIGDVGYDQYDVVTAL